MAKEKVSSMEIISSPFHCLEGTAEALNGSFSQPVHDGKSESALGQK